MILVLMKLAHRLDTTPFFPQQSQPVPLNHVFATLFTITHRSNNYDFNRLQTTRTTIIWFIIFIQNPYQLNQSSISSSLYPANSWHKQPDSICCTSSHDMDPRRLNHHSCLVKFNHFVAETHASLPFSRIILWGDSFHFHFLALSNSISSTRLLPMISIAAMSQTQHNT